MLVEESEDVEELVDDSAHVHAVLGIEVECLSAPGATHGRLAPVCVCV